MFSSWIGIKSLDPSKRQAEFQKNLGKQGEVGAVASFTGIVRDLGQTGKPITEMTLEHYPGMTEKQLARFVTEAQGQWGLLAVNVAHRCGRLFPGDVIVHVLVAARHRREALAACEFLVERLKFAAPFWKKEEGEDGARWVAQENAGD